MAESSDDSAFAFMRLLWAVDHGLQLRSKRMSKERGITGPQRAVLRIVVERQGIAPGEVAKLLHFDPSTISGILKRLEANGFLRSESDPVDRRRSLLAATPKGKRLAENTRGSVESIVRKTLSDIPASVVTHAYLVLDTVARALTDESEK